MQIEKAMNKSKVGFGLLFSMGDHIHLGQIYILFRLLFKNVRISFAYAWLNLRFFVLYLLSWFFFFHFLLLHLPLLSNFQQFIQPCRILSVLMLGQDNIFKGHTLWVNPRWWIIKLKLINSPLSRYKGRTNTVCQFFFCQDFMHINFALKITKVCNTHRDIVIFDC